MAKDDTPAWAKMGYKSQAHFDNALRSGQHVPGGPAAGAAMAQARAAQQKSDAEIARLKAEMDARPKIADMVTPLQNGQLGDAYRIKTPSALQAGQLDVNSLQADPAALNAIKARAMSTGDSPWALMQKEKLGLEELTARDRLPGQAMQASSAANANLAMRGGLQSGARERIARQGMRDMSLANQAVGRDMATNRLNLSIADDAQKMNALMQIPGMDMARAQQTIDMNKFNIGTTMDADKFNKGMEFDANKVNVANTLGALNATNQYNQYKYGQEMAGYAAGKTGQAINNSGGKNGLLNTGIGGSK